MLDHGCKYRTRCRARCLGQSLPPSRFFEEERGPAGEEEEWANRNGHREGQCGHDTIFFFLCFLLLPNRHPLLVDDLIQSRNGCSTQRDKEASTFSLCSRRLPHNEANPRPPAKPAGNPADRKTDGGDW